MSRKKSPARRRGAQGVRRRGKGGRTDRKAKRQMYPPSRSPPRREWGVKTRLYEEGFPAVGYRYEPVRRCRPDTVVPTLIDWERFLR